MLGLSLRSEDLDAMLVHYRAMVKWRRRADLTALVDPREIAIRHYLDSLSVAPHIPEGVTIADLGTGAGFPGIPLAIARRDLAVTLLEAREVKVAFLHHVATMLRRPNLRVARASELRRAPGGTTFGCIVARAVADPEETLARCAHLLAPGGQAWLMRGPSRSGEPSGASHPAFVLAEERALELPIEHAPRRVVIYRFRSD